LKRKKREKRAAYLKKGAPSFHEETKEVFKKTECPRRTSPRK